MTLKEALGKVVGRRDLTREEMARVMGLMLAGEASPAQVGALATAFPECFEELRRVLELAVCAALSRRR